MRLHIHKIVATGDAQRHKGAAREMINATDSAFDGFGLRFGPIIGGLPILCSRRRYDGQRFAEDLLECGDKTLILPRNLGRSTLLFVAQVSNVSNLLFRRFPIGRPESALAHGLAGDARLGKMWRRECSEAPQVGNLRNSRLETCATSEGSPPDLEFAPLPSAT